VLGIVDENAQNSSGLFYQDRRKKGSAFLEFAWSIHKSGTGCDESLY